MSFLPGGGLFQQGAFTIDQNTTPEQLARKRALIASLMPRFGSARYVGEGIGQLATGIAIGARNRALDRFEAGKAAEAGKAFDAIMGGGAESPLTILGMRPETVRADPQSPQGIANDAMTALGKDRAGMIREGLIQRGLPAHVADAFVMNFKDESGLDPAINEKAPVVPGSRGGFGLAQWTGPRRKALENYAAAAGKPVGDLNTQLDFLMMELQGPEAGAAREIMAAGDTGSAASAIVNKFLRPAPEHAAARTAAYTGGNQGRPSIAQLSQIVANPWLSADQRAVAQQMLAEAQQQSDPMRALQMAQAAQQLELGGIELANARNPQPKPVNLTTVTGPDGTVYSFNPTTGETVPLTGAKPQEGPKPTDDMREYEFARSQGFNGTFAEYQQAMRKAGATSVTVGASGEPNSAQALAQTALDPQTMIGGIDAILNDPALARVTGTVEGGGGNDVDQFGMPRRIYYGDDGLALIQRIKQLQDTTFLSARQMLKGGGAITDYEGKKAEAAMARLSRAQSTEAFKSALSDLKDAIKSGEAKLRAAGVAGTGSPAAAPVPPQAAQGGAYRFNPATGKVEPVQ